MLQKHQSMASLSSQCYESQGFGNFTFSPLATAIDTVSTYIPDMLPTECWRGHETKSFWTPTQSTLLSTDCREYYSLDYKHLFHILTHDSLLSRFYVVRHSTLVGWIVSIPTDRYHWILYSIANPSFPVLVPSHIAGHDGHVLDGTQYPRCQVWGQYGTIFD